MTNLAKLPPSPLPWRVVTGDSGVVLGIQNAHGHFILRAGKNTREEIVAYIVACVNAQTAAIKWEMTA